MSEPNDQVRTSASATRRQWDRFAREDAEYYIAGHGEHTTQESFLTSGREIIASAIEYLGPERLGGHMLEIGCGVGRTSQAFASHFDRVTGLDIAPTMIDLAQTLDPPENVEFVVGSGSDLQPVPDATIDFVWSFVVFQHVIDGAVIASTIQDMGRVARSGATAIVQFDTRPMSLGLKAGFALPDRMLPRTRRRGIRRNRRTPDWVRAQLAAAGFGIEAEFDRWFKALPASGTSAFHHFVARRI